ncbi:hypothetical protein [Rhizomonospora bruguierae]|uniref:hypothetical protein n=1 Tax=Rhizomonospora bruguierae TaxID=1581705 RepID=UPI0020BF5B28|nr:hypothetical protein [Micromonospora sp. NBRC 107566]
MRRNTARESEAEPAEPAELPTGAGLPGYDRAADVVDLEADEPDEAGTEEKTDGAGTGRPDDERDDREEEDEEDRESE